MDAFHEVWNGLHPAFLSTCDKESDAALSFLELFLQNSNIVTSVYRKQMLTGLHTEIRFEIYRGYKINLIKILVPLALFIC